MRLDESAYEFENRTSVVLVIGVNGVGKTTSIGKMAGLMKDRGKRVLLAAADTFRAAAIEQLSEWANRSGVEIIAQQAHLPQGDLQRRLVEQIQGDQITVISFGLNDITVLSHLAQGDLLQLGDKIAVLILDVKLDLVLPFPSRELIPGNRRKQRRDRLAVSLLLMDQPLKCDIGPDHLARFVQQRMRQLEIPQESSLDLPVLRGKTDQFIHDHRLIIKHHIKNDGNIKHDKNTEHDARPVIYEIDQDIHSHQ